jgi:acetyltransferase-like isoleucine patch superfamily enzyme
MTSKASQLKPPIMPTPLTRDALKGFILNFDFDIGMHSYGKPRIVMHGNDGDLSIGKYCSISEEVKIFLGGNHRADWITTYPFPTLEEWPEAHCISGHIATKGDVRIGNDVWIGYGACIFSGVTIGDGAIIGANASVFSNVEPYTIVGGNPAKAIRKRFSEEEIKILQKIQWWNWPDDKVRSNLHLLCSADITKICE